MSEFEFVAALTLIFVVAAALLVIATQYELPSVPFYLIAGIGVGLFVDQGLLLDLAQWGIAFLVFAFAVELEPLDGGSMRRDSVIVALAQALLSGMVLFGIAIGIGFDALNALYFAIAATLGSSLVALSLLERRIRLRSLHERLAESIHFVEDLIAVLIILLLSAFVYADGSLLALATGLLLFAIAFGIRYALYERFTEFAGGDVEILMLTGISLLIGFIVLADVGGVSIVVGAFAAGLAVASRYPHDVETIDAIGYVEDFFAPIFFVTLGALLTVPTLEVLGLSAMLVVAVFVINPIITVAILEWRGYDSRTALLTGYSLDQVSEFSLIIAIEALAAGVLAPQLFEAIVVAAIVTMLGSVLTREYVDHGYQWLVARGLLAPIENDVRENSSVADDLSDHVIITGYDREGQQIVEVCERGDHPYLVIESDPTRQASVRNHCDNYVFGDTLTEVTWRVANAETAALIVYTLPRERAAERILSYDLGGEVIVRTLDVETGAALLDRGALFVAIPEVLAAERLSDLVEAVLVGEMTQEELRERGRERLDRAVEYGPSDVRRLR